MATRTSRPTRTLLIFGDRHRPHVHRGRRAGELEAEARPRPPGRHPDHLAGAGDRRQRDERQAEPGEGHHQRPRQRHGCGGGRGHHPGQRHRDRRDPGQGQQQPRADDRGDRSAALPGRRGHLPTPSSSPPRRSASPRRTTRRSRCRPPRPARSPLHGRSAEGPAVRRRSRHRRPLCLGCEPAGGLAERHRQLPVVRGHRGSRLRPRRPRPARPRPPTSTSPSPTQPTSSGTSSPTSTPPTATGPSIGPGTSSGAKSRPGPHYGAAKAAPLGAAATTPTPPVSTDGATTGGRRLTVRRPAHPRVRRPRRRRRPRPPRPRHLR